MDPITLVVAALAAGAALGLSDTTTADYGAYASLKTPVRRRLGSRGDGAWSGDADGPGR